MPRGARNEPGPPFADGGRGAAGSPVTVLIADDDAGFRALLTLALEGSAEVKLVGSAADGETAAALAAKSRPQVAVLDFHMPSGGEQAVRAIHAHSPETRVIALSGTGDRESSFEMLRAGAVGYLVKSASQEEVVSAIVRVARGESILAAEVASGVIGELTAYLDRSRHEERRRLEIQERVRAVIDERLIRPVFQPIVDLETREAVAFEALARFERDPPQSPACWFAEAELVGLRRELELAAVTAAGTAFQRRTGRESLAVNISPDALPLIDAMAREFGPRLVVEVTEHAAIHDYQSTSARFRALRKTGARFAVDDVGAGFASLRHILELEPDFIKLDISLARGIDRDRRRYALSRGLVSIAAELEIEVIAEGIETADELEALRSLGVRYGQGFFLAPPAALGAGEVSHPGTRTGRSRLTPRQRVILELLARGASTPQIATELAISHTTVRNHVAGLLKALEAHSRLEAIVKARDKGLLKR